MAPCWQKHYKNKVAAEPAIRLWTTCTGKPSRCTWLGMCGALFRYVSNVTFVINTFHQGRCLESLWCIR